MRVVRPKKILGTPKKLSELFNAPLVKVDAEQFSSTDFFMAYPSSDFVRFTSIPQLRLYSQVRDFYASNKFMQRRILGAYGLPVPVCWQRRNHYCHSEGNAYIVRPLKHYGGHNYKITNDPNDFSVNEEYCSLVVPKDREYRVIFVKGKPCLYLRKKNPLGLPSEAAWNHAQGCTFQTINDIASCKLTPTRIVQNLENNDVIKGASIVAVDILYVSGDRPKVFISEFNFCPGITLPNNLQKVVDTWNSNSQQQSQTAPSQASLTSRPSSILGRTATISVNSTLQLEDLLTSIQPSSLRRI